MWRNRERPDDPQTRERETQRLARDEYERPLYAAPQQPGEPRHHGSPPHQNQGVRYQTANWSYAPPPAMPHLRGTPNVQPAAPQRNDLAGSPQRPLEQMAAHEIMTRRVGTVHPATSIERAARLLEECDCGSLPVVGDNGVLVGMVTDRDIVLRIIARGRDVRAAIVADCMTEHVFACYANEPVGECMRQMSIHQVRRMPIVDERGRLVGILAQADLARHARERAAEDERRAVGQVVGEVSLGTHANRR